MSTDSSTRRFPAVAARVVGDLLVDQAGAPAPSTGPGDRASVTPQDASISRARPAPAPPAHRTPATARSRAGCAGTAIGSEQRRSGRTRRSGGPNAQSLSRIGAVVGLGHPVCELRGGLSEHGVVDGVLRGEVGVDGGRRDPTRRARSRSDNPARPSSRTSAHAATMASRADRRGPARHPASSGLYHRSVNLYGVQKPCQGVRCRSTKATANLSSSPPVALHRWTAAAVRPSRTCRHQFPWAHGVEAGRWSIPSTLNQRSRIPGLDEPSLARVHIIYGATRIIRSSLCAGSPGRFAEAKYIPT